MKRTAAVLLVSLALVALGVPALQAHPIAHPGPPRVRNLHPAFGEVVPAGTRTLSAQVVSDVDITGWVFKLDGAVVPATLQGSASHPGITTGPLDVGAGDHIAQLDVT